MKILYVSWWGNIKWGQKYKCHCQRVSAVTFCWCVLFMFFNMYVWRNDVQYLWSSLERDCTKLLSISATIHFRLVSGTWTVSLCVCCGVCVFACPRTSVCTRVDSSCKKYTKKTNMKWIPAFWLVDYLSQQPIRTQATSPNTFFVSVIRWKDIIMPEFSDGVILFSCERWRSRACEWDPYFCTCIYSLFAVFSSLPFCL